MSEFDHWMKKHRTKLSGAAAVIFLFLSQPSSITLYCGAVFILVGQAMRIWSAGHIHKNEVLTVTGPYSLSRNPLYVGSFILGTGFMIAMGVIWLAIGFLIFFAFVYWFTIKWEEEKLERKFPDVWEEYKASVPRFLPFRRLPGYRSGEFSWAQVKRYKELQNATAVLVIYLILLAKAFLMGG